MIKITKMKVQIFLVFSFLFFSPFLFGQTVIEKQLQQFTELPDYKNALIGIHVADLETGKTMFEMNSNKLFIPASVLKLVTSAAALEILGPDYRFKTSVGYSGKIINGTLKGDLIIIGGGDPALGSEYFKDRYFAPHFLETWAKQIRAAGIKRIDGNLVLDGSLYDSQKIPRTWIWEDMGNYYGAGTSALTIYDNQFRISFRSPEIAGLPTEMISVYPKVNGLHFQNEVLSSDMNSDQAYVFGSPIDGTRIIRGTIPKNRRAFTIKASNPFPENLLAEEFVHFLAREGVFLSGQIVFEKEIISEFNQVYVTESPTLAEIVKVLNFESVNLFAEHLVKQIAAETTGIGSLEPGLKIISEFWENNGLNTLQIFMEDGSGLSHFNAVSPAFLTSVLRYMANTSKNSASFSESLPTAGQGTLYHFNSQNFPGKMLRAKSGSMTRVRCYVGYIQSISGHNLSFSIMVNHFSGSHQKLISELEKLLLAIHENY
jgi:D-alanyl-D-alanine carboxypeptidase/D-alanyl-D-alanine-endopeptidase (penicillin-binding protein 4)